MTEAEPPFIPRKQGEGVDEYLPSSELDNLLPVYAALEHMMESPMGGDSRVSDYARAARWLMHHEPRFRESLAKTIDFREQRGRPTPPLYLANLTLRSVQHLLRRQRNYGLISNSPRGWSEGITHLLDREEREIDLVGLTDLMMHKEIQTVVDARYKAAQLYVALHPEYFNRPIRYLDMGTSAGTAAKAFISGQIKHMVGVNVVVPANKGSGYPEASLQSHDKLTGYVQQKLGIPIDFDVAVGADITDPEDEAEREWIKSCYYPSEVVENKNRIITKFDHLAKMKLDNWTTLKLIDCASPEAPTSIRQRSGVDKFDLITVFTMFNQLTEAERVQVIDNAMELLAPGGVLLESDFAKTSSQAPSGLEFYDVWFPYTYRTAERRKDSGKGWEDVFWWSNGRCTDVIIAPSANFLTGHTPLNLNQDK